MMIDDGDYFISAVNGGTCALCGEDREERNDSDEHHCGAGYEHYKLCDCDNITHSRI
jgi:hypothetical protein